MKDTELEHKKMVRTLVKPGALIIERLNPSKADLWHGATGVATEAGELLDAVKKCSIYCKAIDRDNVIEELGDLEFYMEQVRQNLNITREETLRGNLNKLAERYANYQYSDQQAQDRKDKAEKGETDKII